MDLDRLRNAWQAQDAGPIGGEAALDVAMRKSRQFERSVFWRDVREVGVALALIPVWILGAHTVARVAWPWYVGVACLAWIAAFIVIDRRIWREPKPGASVQASLERTVRGVEHQIRLLRNVVAWYLLPCLVSTLLATGEMAAQLPREAWRQWQVCRPFAVILGGVILLYPGIYWLNQYAVRRYLTPLKVELEDALRELRNEE